MMHNFTVGSSGVANISPLGHCGHIKHFIRNELLPFVGHSNLGRWGTLDFFTSNWASNTRKQGH